MQAENIDKFLWVGEDKDMQKRFSKKTVIIIAGIFILIFMVFLAILLTRNENEKTQQAQIDQQNGTSQTTNKQNSLQSSESSTNTLVYGAWEAKQSAIKSVDLLSGESALLAKLPLEIKRVKVLSPEQLIYINQTNTQDHGKQIVRFGIKDKVTEVLIAADPGFGIDDYVISPNKKYMAVWEVSFAPGSKILRNGRSRVYTVDLSISSNKQLIYDELASPTTPIHYAQAILDNGKVFADTFLPNDPNGGAGWSYGMSVSNFSGSEKSDLSQMQNGSYGTQPILSPDGKSLAFAGYDGSRGPGKLQKAGIVRHF